MPAHIGVTNLNGLVTPASGFAHQSVLDSKQEVVTTKDDTGKVIFADPKPYLVQNISLKGTGTPLFSLVTIGAITPGTLKIHEVKLTESQDKRPEFEIMAINYVNAA